MRSMAQDSNRYPMQGRRRPGALLCPPTCKPSVTAAVKPAATFPGLQCSVFLSPRCRSQAGRGEDDSFEDVGRGLQQADLRAGPPRGSGKIAVSASQHSSELHVSRHLLANVCMTARLYAIRQWLEWRLTVVR